MAEEQQKQRDSKGRFLPGNKLSPSPYRKGDEYTREMARRGAEVTNKKIAERKTIAAALRAVLDEPANADGVTRREAIIAKVVKRVYDEGSVRDLEVLARILGELDTKVTLDTSDDRGLLIAFAPTPKTADEQ